MAKTKADLSTQVLRQMNIIAAQETASSSDASYVEGVYDTKLKEWRELGLVYWPNTTRTTSEIPDAVFGMLADLMENEIGNAFGRQNPQPQRMAIEENMLGRLRRHMAKKPSGESTTFSSF